MIKQKLIEHKIQKHIIAVLMYQKQARFRDLRPSKTDTNLFSYHLKLLQQNKLIQKIENNYTLSQKGLYYVECLSNDKTALRTQPKVISMLLIQNSNGDVLLQRITKQPYIECWTLPSSQVRVEDKSIESVATRQVFNELGLAGQLLRHAGDCYIRVKDDEEVLSSTLAHIFSFNRDNIDETDNLKWVRPHKLADYELAPAVDQIIARGFFRDPYFFEEFNEIC